MRRIKHLALFSCMSLLACSCNAREDTSVDGSAAPQSKSGSPGLGASDAEATAWANETLAKLSLEQKIGQMICEQMQGNVAEDSPEFAKVLDLVRKHQIGALCVYGGSPVKTAALFNRLQKESKLPLFISMDFEGGPGQQLAGATEFPANMALAAIGSEEITYAVGKAGAEEGRACGVHITYSPVVDVSTRPDRPTSSVRSFGGDIDLVSRMAAAYIRGYQENGMLATAKHFPGRGDVDPIVGTQFSVNPKPAEQVEAQDFRPFKAAVDAGAVYMMSEHVAVPSVTGGSDLPASVEKRLITGVVRENLGFKGIFTSDDMWYPSVVERFGPVRACVMAIAAGQDVVLKPADVPATIEGLVKAVRDGEISAQQIDQSVKKILYWKARLGLHRERLVDVAKIPSVVRSKEHVDLLNTVADRSLTLLVNNGFFPADASKMSKVRKIAHLTVQKMPEWPNAGIVAARLEELLPDVETTHVALGAKDAPADVRDKALDAAREADLVVVSLFCQRDAYANPAPMTEANAAILEEVIRLKPKATVVMSYGNPHFTPRFKNAAAFVVGYGEAGWYGNQTVYADAFVRLLKGQITPQGKLPVKVSDEFPIGAGVVY
ncbi:MAG TPA: glycoside hydrolase family 3 N-terminal domain-containing protein [Thermoguttaceae bacterium]|nr:glycoside hydrolase family 3 N-terminal domain-containing protein [Thermoguttaceae bacterium]